MNEVQGMRRVEEKNLQQVQRNHDHTHVVSTPLLPGIPDQVLGDNLQFPGRGMVLHAFLLSSCWVRFRETFPTSDLRQENMYDIHSLLRWDDIPQTITGEDQEFRLLRKSESADVWCSDHTTRSRLEEEVPQITADRKAGDTSCG